MPTLSELQAARGTWRISQGPMSECVRWGNFPTYGQKLGQHVNSLPSVIMFVKSALTRLGNFDWALIYECAHLHDHGEPLTGGDEHDGNKTQDKEIREYRAFRDVVSIEGEQLQTAKMMAFLLPYVRRTKWWSEFSLQDQKIVRQLATTHHREAIVFELIERMDYVFSGLEGYQLGITNEAETMLSHVLRNQVPKLNALTAELKVLTQVWGLELSQELLTLES